jgi:ATP-dependent Lon protease
MNDDSLIMPALRDRLDIIEIPTYNRDEMVQIIKLYTLPEALLDKGIPKGDVSITDQAAYQLLNRLRTDVDNSGMRPVEKAVNNIVSRINFLRTMFSNKNTQSQNCEIPIPYKPKDFHGLPYTITVDNINILHTQSKEITLNYFI